MEIIKQLRNKKNLNQQKLADLLNVSRSTVAMWETGKSEPNKELLLRLAEIFHVSTDYLLGKTDFSAEENRRICQNVTRLWRTIKHPPNPENIIGITLPFQQIQKNEYQFTYAVLEQIASYFDVGIDALTASPDPAEAKELSNVDIMISTEAKDLSDKDKDEVLSFIQYKKFQKETGSSSTSHGARTFTTADFEDHTERIAAFGGMEDTDEEPLTT